VYDATCIFSPLFQGCRIRGYGGPIVFVCKIILSLGYSSSSVAGISEGFDFKWKQTIRSLKRASQGACSCLNSVLES
jgi:hypothetical protein